MRHLLNNQNSIHLHPTDNVRVLTIHLSDTLSKGHKVACTLIPQNTPIIKWGQIIGLATLTIHPGEHVHLHNVTSHGLHSTHFVTSHQLPLLLSTKSKSFFGFVRNPHTAGIRNYIVVVSTVNCSATVVQAIARHCMNQKSYFKKIDGIIPITHTSGCALSQQGETYHLLNRTLAGWIFHPNVVGAVLVGLGCEAITLKSVLTHASPREIPLIHFNIQDHGGTQKSIAHGIQCVQKIFKQIPSWKRTELPNSMLKIALNCGGSDAFSSITANPALGIVSNTLTAQGATVILAEIPECTGTETMLHQRCAHSQVQKDLKKVFSWWKKHAKKQNFQLNENLSPGNHAGGITTILEKSFGALSKGGSSTITEILDYAASPTKTGLLLMNTPGFDPVSVTGLVAAGCHLVAFTTGRGSIYGCSIAPTLKIASHSDLFESMSDDMDIDAGKALQKKTGLRFTAKQIYQTLLQVAHGQRTASERLGLGFQEFTPWILGDTL